MKKTSILKLSLIAAASATLVACGGGGGGGSISAASNPPAVTPTWDYSPGQTYNPGDRAKTVGGHETTIGQRDVNGQQWSQIFSGTNTMVADPSTNLNGKVLAPAHPEVLAAHRDGWTGKGVDVAIVDGFTLTTEEHSRGEIAHGHVTSTIVARYAPGATVSGIEVFDPNIAGTAASISSIRLAPAANGFTVQDVTQETNNRFVDVKVLNFSIGSSVPSQYNPVNAVNTWQHYLDFSKTNNSEARISDAVIVKAAGNDRLRAETDSMNVAFMSDAGTRDRTILVGATNGTSGNPDQKATFANYSNTCGNYCSSYVTAGGADPFGNYSVQGTSFAAPRVAGYVAIVRQKFETVNGVQAADIILKTARTDTINGYDKNIHGMGEASLSRALSPIGKLR